MKRESLFMKKISARLLLLSCFVAPAFALPVQAQQTQQSFTMQTTVVQPNANNNSSGSSSGSSGSASQQPMQPASPALPPTAPTIAGAMAQQQQQSVTMRYNKKEMESMFYGVEIPSRLFNNVPSDW